MLKELSSAQESLLLISLVLLRNEIIPEPIIIVIKVLRDMLIILCSRSVVIWIRLDQEILENLIFFLHKLLAYLIKLLLFTLNLFQDSMQLSSSRNFCSSSSL